MTAVFLFLLSSLYDCNMIWQYTASLYTLKAYADMFSPATSDLIYKFIGSMRVIIKDIDSRLLGGGDNFYIPQSR